MLLTDGVYPHVIGGMQKHSYYLAKHLSGNGIHVELIHCVYNEDPTGKDEKLKEFFTHRELQFLNFKCYRFPLKGKFPGHYLLENRIYSGQVYKDYESKILNKEYSFIYIQGFCGHRILIEKKKKGISTPLLVNLHGFEMYQKAPNLKLRLQYSYLRREAKKQLLWADVVFSFGGEITDIITNMIKVNPHKIIKSYNGIDNSWLNASKDIKPGEGLRKFVFVGRYERRKGVEELTMVLKELLRENHKFEFHFIGPIPALAQIQHLQVVYHGQINNQEQLKAIVEQCDVLVCPSHSEGMPTVILEAMACGLAVIATNVGAVECMVDQNNGKCIERNNQQQLKIALIEVMQMKGKQLCDLKSNSIEKVKNNFLWNQIVEQLLKDLGKLSRDMV